MDWMSLDGRRIKCEERGEYRVEKEGDVRETTVTKEGREKRMEADYHLGL